MKITDLRVTAPFGPFEWILVRVDTDQGISGYGELPIFSRVAPDDLAQLREGLVGRRPHDVDPLIQPLLGGLLHARNRGLVHAAETALLDLTGKDLGVPVYLLLGGKYRERVRLYADCHAGVHWTLEGIRRATRQVAETGRFLDAYRPAAFAAQARQVVEMGYTAVKFDADFPTPSKRDLHDGSISPAELREMVEAVAAVRQAVGPDVDIAVDLHARYHVADALRVAYEMEPFNLMWLEDPIPPGNHEALAKLTAKSRVPICTGEALETMEQFRDLVTRQAADILQPDTPRSCGPRDLKRIADLAGLYSIAIAPHNMTTPVGTLAAVHGCAAVPNFLALENHCLAIPWWNDLVTGAEPLIRHGHIAVPEAPGLGFELNEEALAARCPAPLWR